MSTAKKFDHYASESMKLNAYIKSVDVNKDENVVTITGFANTVSKDRAGDVIPASAWKSTTALTNFMKNPILLFGHDHSRPIGKVVDIVVTEMGLQVTAEVYKESDESIFNLIKRGVLKTFSIGFCCLDADWDSATDIFIIKELELYEISVVSVPCNQDSIFSVAKSMTGSGFTEFRKHFKQERSEATPAKEPITSELEKLAIALGLA